MKYFVIVVFAAGAALLAWRFFQSSPPENEAYYEIVAFHSDSTDTVLRRIKPSELPIAVRTIKPPEYQPVLVNSNEEVVKRLPQVTGRAAVAVFAAQYRMYVYSTDAQGNPDNKVQTTVSGASTVPGNLDVILVIDRDNNIAVDKEGNPIWFDAAFASELLSGPLPEPGIKTVTLVIDEKGNLVLDAAKNPILCGPSIGAPMTPKCKRFTARKLR